MALSWVEPGQCIAGIRFAGTEGMTSSRDHGGTYTTIMMLRIMLILVILMMIRLLRTMMVMSWRRIMKIMVVAVFMTSSWDEGENSMSWPSCKPSTFK